MTLLYVFVPYICKFNYNNIILNYFTRYFQGRSSAFSSSHEIIVNQKYLALDFFEVPRDENTEITGLASLALHCHPCQHGRRR